MTKAYRAIGILTTAPKQVVPFVQESLKRMAPDDRPKPATLIADLDSDDFAVREVRFPIGSKGVIGGPKVRKMRELEKAEG